MSHLSKIKVLIVDDSAIVRHVLGDVLSSQPDIEVVGTAPAPYIARDKIITLKADVLTLDIEMPRMDGLTFLDRLMAAHPMPVIVISSLTQHSTQAALEAVNRGAVDVLAKPGGPYSVGQLMEDLPRRIRAAATARVRRVEFTAPQLAGRPPLTPATTVSEKPTSSRVITASGPIPPSRPGAGATPVVAEGAAWRRDYVVAIGASTGGTQAIECIMRALPQGFPAVVITQHIPPGFSAAFAERLNRTCPMTVVEAHDGDILKPGTAYIAPGNWHMQFQSGAAGATIIRLDDGPKEHYQRPAVDVMFRSALKQFGKRTVGVLLTGMGKDGAAGLLGLRRAGCHTIAQDEASSVVFGMPREAIELGAAAQVVALPSIAGEIMRVMTATTSKVA
jgi:two-component system chemotaxis response regulator CheB